MFKKDDVSFMTGESWQLERMNEFIDREKRTRTRNANFCIFFSENGILVQFCHDSSIP